MSQELSMNFSVIFDDFEVIKKTNNKAVAFARSIIDKPSMAVLRTHIVGRRRGDSEKIKFDTIEEAIEWCEG